MTHPKDADEDEGTALDVHVDLPSVITVSVETAARARPADGGPAASPELRAASASEGSGADEDRSISLVTRSFDSEGLARLERASSEAVSALAEASPALDEPDTRVLVADPRSPADEDGDTTLLRAAEQDGAVEADEATLDPRVAIEDGPSIATARHAGSTNANARDRDQALAGALPPMRPPFDSEAARQWAPWHEQPEEARAALSGVASPVSTGTEVLPRSTVQQAFRMLSSQTSLAPEPRSTAPSPQARFAPQAPSQPRGSVPRDSPRRPERPSADSASGTIGKPIARPAKDGASPFVAFLIAFVLTASVFGGAVAARWYGWLSFGKSGAPGTTATSEAPRPPASAAPRPSVSEAPRPSVSEAPRPSVSEAPRPLASSASRASEVPATDSPAASTSAPSTLRTGKPGGATRSRSSPRTARP